MLNTTNHITQSLSPSAGASPVAWLLDNPDTQPTAEQLADIAARLGRGLPGTPSITRPKNDASGLYLEFRLLQPNPQFPGHQDEVLTAKFSFSRIKGNIDKLRLPTDEKAFAKFNRQGWGKIFSRNLFSEAIESGVPRFGLRSEKVGSYLWLKCGFEVDPDSRLSPQTWKIEKNISPEGKQRLGELIRAKDHWGLADFTDGGKKYGYDLTYDTEWSGSLDLTKPKALERLKSYLGMEEPVRATPSTARAAPRLENT